MDWTSADYLQQPFFLLLGKTTAERNLQFDSIYHSNRRVSAGSFFGVHSYV